MGRRILFLILCLLPPNLSWADIHTAAEPVTLSTIQAAYDAASPGDHVVVPDGTYTVGQINLDTDCTEGNEITFRAETPGGVTFTGDNNAARQIRITGDFNIVKDFYFNQWSNPGGSRQIIQADGADDIRITDCHFKENNQNNDSERMRSLQIGPNTACLRTEIDYCTFDGNEAMDIVVYPNSKNAHIHHNYFTGYSETGNPIQLAIHVGGDYSTSVDNYYTIENNYFYNCKADESLIDNKGSSNTYRYNYFSGCWNGIIIRGGDDNAVNRNYFFNCGSVAEGEGPIRVHGADNQVINNYFEDSTHVNIDIPDGGTNYERTADCLVAYNTLIGVDFRGIRIGAHFGGGTLPVTGLTVKNNIISGDDGILIQELTSGNTYTTNVAHATGSASYGKTHAGINQADPELTQDTYLQRPTDSSSAVYEKGTADENVTEDIDGQSRDGSTPDIGCDEYDASTVAPILSTQVGITWPYPIISNASPSGALNCTDDPRDVIMSWSTNKDCDCRIDTSDVGDYDNATPSSVSNTGGTSHSDIEFFACDGSYNRYVYCEDNFGNEVGVTTISFSIASGTPPPPISVMGSSVGGGVGGGSMGGS